MANIHRLDTHPGPQTIALQSPATEILYGGAAGGGKALQVDALVLTPWGWKPIGSLKEGSKVCATDGTVTEVIGVYPQGKRPLFRVTMQDGGSVLADEDHLWLAWRTHQGRKKANARQHGEASARKYTTAQMRDELQKRLDGQRRATMMLPVCSPVALNVAGSLTGPSRFVGREIDPYLCGLLLGDGCVRGDKPSLCSADDEIIDYVRALTDVTVDDRGSVRVARFVGEERVRLLDALNGLGLHDKFAWQKRVPRAYLFGPIEDRWAVLQGLMDTDGWVEPGRAAYFTSTSEGLADDVMHLVRSLGGLASKTTKTPHYHHGGERREGRPAYTVRIKLRDPSMAFRLPRKVSIAQSIEHQSFGRIVQSIEPEGEGEAVCIRVAHRNSLFITNDFIVTHNSYLIRLKHLICALQIPNFQGYIFRLTGDELRMNHLEGPASFPMMCKPWIDSGEVDYNQQQLRFTFKKTGSIIRFRHMGDEKHQTQAYGWEISGLSMDELTHFTEDRYRFLRSRMRHSGEVPDGIPYKVPWALSGSNPGNVGHAWVKRTFIDMCEPYEIRDMKKLYPDGSEGGLTRQFIPAKVRDNPSIKADDYEFQLAGLGSPEMVAAMRDGNWNVALGARFGGTWTDDIMIPSFKIPNSWQLYRALDWGTAKPFSYGLYAVCNGEQPRGDSIPYMPRGTRVRIGEIYGWNGKADQGCGMTATQVAKKIRMYESSKGLFSRVQPGAADPKTWKLERDQRSAASDFHAEGVRFVPANAGPGSRVAGWRNIDAMFLAVKQRSFHEPALYAFEDECPHFKRLMPSVPRDRNDPDDVNSKAEDHLPDEVRYEVSRYARPSSFVEVGGL